MEPKQNKMTHKRLLNDTNKIVFESLDGLTLSCEGISRLRNFNVALRRMTKEEKEEESKVSLISGGGFGHSCLSSNLDLLSSS